MDDFRVPVSLPLDSDGFLRRECPSCERQFKWFSHDEGDEAPEPAHQYFCPICGVPAGVDAWWTKEQLEYVRGAAGPAIDELLEDAIADMFKGMKGVEFKPNSSFSLEIETPGALAESDDMVIVEPPCHPNEPLKIPEEMTARIHCLVCGSQFAA